MKTADEMKKIAEARKLEMSVLTLEHFKKEIEESIHCEAECGNCETKVIIPKLLPLPYIHPVLDELRSRKFNCKIGKKYGMDILIISWGGIF